MYLARTPFPGRTQFILRRSVSSEAKYIAEDVYVLGADPSAFVRYAGGNSFYLDEALVEAVQQKAPDCRYEDLEDILWPFVDPAVRRSLRGFRHRGGADGRRRQAPPVQKEQIEALHRIDRQRLQYLRLGTLDQSRLGGVPSGLYRPLLFKSRDELEQYFMALEQDLAWNEQAVYCYSFLNLRRFFYEIHAGKMPQALDQEKLDRLFVRELCSLDADQAFWSGMDRGPDLHPYLIRYVLMFFDSSFGPSPYLQDIFLDFMARRRFHKPPSARERPIPPQDMSSIFLLPHAELRALSAQELTRLYRKLAKEKHPDLGGDHEEFVRLNQAYLQLMKRKKRTG